MKRLVATGILLICGVANLSAQTSSQSTPEQPERIETSVAASPIPLVGPRPSDLVPEEKLERLTQGGGQRSYILQQYEQMLAAQRAAGIEDPIRRAEQVVDQRPDRYNAVRQIRYGDPVLEPAPEADRIGAAVQEPTQIRQASSSSFWDPAPNSSPYLEQPRVPPSPRDDAGLVLGPDEDPFAMSRRQVDPFIDPNPTRAAGPYRQDQPQRSPDTDRNPQERSNPPQNPFADPPEPTQSQPTEPEQVPPMIQAPRDSSAVPPKTDSELPPIVTPEQAMQRSGACDAPVCDAPVAFDRGDMNARYGSIDGRDDGGALFSPDAHSHNRMASRPLLNALGQRRESPSRFGLKNLVGNRIPGCDDCAECGPGAVGCDSCNGCCDALAGVCAPTVYYSVFGGFASANDFSSAQPSSGYAASYSFDDAFAIGAAVGQIQGRQLRTELEFTYRDHDVDQVTLLGPLGNSVFNGSGELRAYSGMTNVYWEFVNSPFPALHPYVGGGVGFAFFESNFAVQGNPIVSPDYQTDSAFAYQAMAGLNWCTAPNMSMFVEYRYFATDGIRVAGSLGGNAVNGKFDYQSNNVFAGVRFKF